MFSTQEFVTETPFFCNLLLKTLFAADAAGRAQDSPRASDKRGQCKKLRRQKAVGYADRRYTMDKYFNSKCS